jgi:hypothetical protein
MILYSNGAATACEAGGALATGCDCSPVQPAKNTTMPMARLIMVDSLLFALPADSIHSQILGSAPGIRHPQKAILDVGRSFMPAVSPNGKLAR